MKTKAKKVEFTRDIRFIRPSKVQLSKRGQEILVYLGPNVISLHRNFIAAILNPKKKAG